MAIVFPPPYTPEGAGQAALRDEGYAVMSPSGVAAATGLALLFRTAPWTFDLVR